MTQGHAVELGLEVLLSVLRERDTLGSLSQAQWTALVPAAEAARLFPRLALEAERLGLTNNLPSWIADRLASARLRGREYERVVRWEINRIQRALVHAGLRPVFLKGAAYVAKRLPCGVGRVVADVDVLVAEVDIARAETALREHGWEFVPLTGYDDRYYRQWMHELPPMRHRERGTMLDVHHRLLPKTGRVHPPTSTLLEKAVEVEGTAVLSPEHMVLHSAAHLFQDGEVGGALRDLVDLRDLLESLSADQLRQLGVEAQALGLSRALCYSVRYARLVGCKVTSVDTQPGSPAPIVLAMMDRLVERTLTRPRGALTALSIFCLYLRAHWLRMPTGLLARHLWRKATTRFRRPNKKKGERH